MSHKIPLMVAAALAALLVLTAVQAQGPHSPAQGPHPLVDVSTTFDAADETSASGTITVCNVSEDSVVTIDTIDDSLFYKQGPGLWTWLAEAEVSDLGAGNVIPAGECKDYSWAATYTLPDGTTDLRNEVRVSIEERDKVFVARECFHFGQ